MVLLQLIVLENTVVPFSFENVLFVTHDVMKKISSLENPPSMMGVCKKKEYTEIVGEKVVLLEGIQDPGNLGTIIRSSLAFGVTSLVLSPTCVDCYNSKVLRGTQGMIFQLPIVVMDIKDAISQMREKNIPIYGTSVVGGVDAASVREKNRFCLVMGNEGSGVSQDVLSLCDQNLYIPMENSVESLNVGVACSILLYEMSR